MNYFLFQNLLNYHHRLLWSSYVTGHLQGNKLLICFPQQTKFKGNLLTIEEGFGKASGIEHDRATPKPVLYEALIHLLSTRGQWILDPIGGIGELPVLVWIHNMSPSVT